MFTKFRVQNFKTHIDTEISLKETTLLIGANNSGKTNLLEALSLFSKLLRNELDVTIDGCRHNSMPDTPIIFSCEFDVPHKEFYGSYIVKIFGELNFWDPIYEKLEIKDIYTDALLFERSFGVNEWTNPQLMDDAAFENYTSNHIDTSPNRLGMILSLEEEIAKIDTDKSNKSEGSSLDWSNKLDILYQLKKLSRLQYYNFQPFLLKGLAKKTFIEDDLQNKRYIEHIVKSNLKDRFSTQIVKSIDLGEELGSAGEHLSTVIQHIKAHESTIYNRFVNLLRTFDPSFAGIDSTSRPHGISWQFDTGNHELASFSSSDISDGLAKAAAVAVLCALDNPPPIIMIEEVENGINQKRLREFLEWMDGSAKKNVQFILTTHSVSVIREFANKLDCVYTVHLKRRKSYTSDVSNMNEAIKILLKMGTVDEDMISETEDELVKVKPAYLTELFYNGILGTI